MINTGALLRHPAESDYAIVRRVMIANPGMSSTSIKKALTAMLGGVAARKLVPPGDIAAAVRVLETPRFGESRPSIASGDVTIRRNCARCASIAYHCAAYDLSWLTHCPLHHDVLTSACPRCQRPWPAARDLPLRGCDVCGVSLTVHGLADRGAFLESTFAPCEFLLDCLNHPQLPGVVQLNAGPRRPEWRPGQLSPANPFFPSLLQACDPAVARRLLNLGAPMEPAITVHSPSPLVIVGDDEVAAINPRACAAIRRLVLASVYRILSTPTHAVRLVPATENVLYRDYCTACVAFSIWYYLLTYVDRNTRPETTPPFARELFQRPFVRLYPRMPAPMQCISIKNIQYQLPKALAYSIYALDLWTTFTHLANFAACCLDHLHDPDQLIRDFLATLPEDAHPDCCISQSVGFFCTNERAATLAFPRQLCDFDRAIFSESPCQSTQNSEPWVYGLTNSQYRRFVSTLYPSPDRPIQKQTIMTDTSRSP